MVRKIKPKVVAVIQARLKSTRLPGKVMMDLCGKTILTRVIERVRAAKSVDEICIATSSLHRDDIIEAEAQKSHIKIYRGSENDVLDRYCKAAIMMRADFIVRITADNPLTEPRFIDSCVKKILTKDFDFVAIRNMPYGSNVEVVKKDALLKVGKKTWSKGDREHVTRYFYRNSKQFKMCLLEPIPKLQRPDIRITLDTIKDYEVLYKTFSHFKRIPTRGIKLEDVIDILDLAKNKDEAYYEMGPKALVRQ